MCNFLATQPILDVHNNVYGYEVLHRSSKEDQTYTLNDGDKASLAVMHLAFNEIGLKDLTNNKPVFVNFSANLINSNIVSLFPPEQLVIEVLEDVIPTQELVKKCSDFKRNGYLIALDDFIIRPELDSLISLADIVKVDFLKNTKEQIKYIASKIKYPTRLLAEKVETYEMFEFAKDLGFTLFQGYYFSRPIIYTSKSLSPSRMNYFRLLQEVNLEEINFDHISGIISQDVYLSYNVLKLVNSVSFGLSREITSIKQAVTFMGQNGLRKWLTLILLRGIGENCPEELIRMSVVRAKYLEQLALSIPEYKQYASELFIVGLLSLLDTIMNKPMKELMDSINVHQRIYDVLVNKSGIYNDLVEIVIAHELGDFDTIISKSEKLIDNHDLVFNSYLSSVTWYNTLISSLHS